MSLIAKKNGERISPMEEGMYQAVCTGLIDTGLQMSEVYKKESPKVIIMWSFPTQTIDVNGEKIPRVISREYTRSLNDRSNLTRDLQAWRGKNFTPEELDGFQLINVLHAPCLIQIIHEEKNSNTYPKIASIMALPKDMQTIDLENTQQETVFDFDDPATWNAYHTIPAWIQNRIKQATNYESSGLQAFVEQFEAAAAEEQGTPASMEDDLPF